MESLCPAGRVRRLFAVANVVICDSPGVLQDVGLAAPRPTGSPCVILIRIVFHQIGGALNPYPSRLSSSSANRTGVSSSRRNEQARGTALAGLAFKIVDGVFLVGLRRADYICNKLAPD
jgi:hypothetical protein